MQCDLRITFPPGRVGVAQASDVLRDGNSLLR
jgi:hypothetical protein